jgi:hypothetical protein
VSVSRRFGRPSPVRAYWLARCEGFELKCRDGSTGVVKQVVLDATSTEAQALVVRTGRVLHRSVVVTAEQVDAVAPFEEVLVGNGLQPPARRPTSTVGRTTNRILIRALRTGLALLRWLLRRTRILVPRLARHAWSGGQWAAPRLLTVARTTGARLRLAAAAAALFASAAAQWLALKTRALAVRLSNETRPR